MPDNLPRILCMYSGGLDSVGVLYRLLVDEEYAGFTVHVHHMRLNNREDRARAESQAFKSTLDAFKSVAQRPFDYSESVHDYRFMKQRFV